MKASYRERLDKKSKSELKALAKRMGCPIGANYTKQEICIALNSSLKSRAIWDGIAGIKK
jgi:hypothetical protein